MSRYYEEARELSRRITSWSDDARVAAEALRRSAPAADPESWKRPTAARRKRAGPPSGLSIQLPHEQRPNPYITPELNFCFHYFFMRKLWFAQMAKALIVFPGGFGTMDELWEVLTLMQTKKMSSHHLILIYGRKYWHKVIDWRHMVRTGTVSEREYKMLQFADTVDEAFERVRSEMEKHHLDLDVGLRLAATSGGAKRTASTQRPPKFRACRKIPPSALSSWRFPRPPGTRR